MRLAIGEKTLIMGILNVTPDSFYDGGRYFYIEEAVKRAYKLRDEGADIIDIGGESTRPGSKKISASEEIERVCPVIEAIINDIDIPISIDTYKAEVAEAALRLGAGIVNDISAMTFDDKMADVAAGHDAKVILMHIKGTPENMQINPQYENLLEDIYLFLENAKQKALKSGIKKENIIIDPGIGFGKKFEDNYQILRNLEYFRGIGCPVLVGVSRKSMIGRLYDGEYERLYATIALNAASVLNGADIIRVHDVLANRLAMISVDALKKERIVFK
ncbi:MAG: dihydropteroate synthase [Spirochaetes bacterium]|nr:dihydropteroate synthase [Spirochaetota bacterium]